MRLRPIPVTIYEEFGVTFKLMIFRNPNPEEAPVFWKATINKMPIEGLGGFDTVAEAFRDAQSTLFEE